MALRKLALMHQQFGVCYGHSCGECSNLVSGRYRGRILRKCEVYGLTHSEASDWAKRWVACEMLNGIYTGRPIIELCEERRWRKCLWRIRFLCWEEKTNVRRTDTAPA